MQYCQVWWLGSRVVSVLDSGAEGPGFLSCVDRRIWLVKNLTGEESTDVFYHLLTFHLDWLHFRFTSVSTSVASTRSILGSDWLIAIYNYNNARVRIAAATLSGNSLRQTVHTHRASIHQTAKLVAALLRVARVRVGLAESNGSLPPGLWLTSHAGWLPRTGISSGTLRSAVEYGLSLTVYLYLYCAVQVS